MHPIAPPLPAVDDATGRQVVLGRIGGRHPALDPGRRGALRDFPRPFGRSRYRRFFTAGDPTNALIERLSDSTVRLKA